MGMAVAGIESRRAGHGVTSLSIVGSDSRTLRVPKSAPSWWPDWSGLSAAIVACGPSAKRAGVERIRGKLSVIAIKEAAVDLCPWADTVYGCDAAWWKHRNGLPKFGGLRIGWEPKIATSFPDVRLIEIRDPNCDAILCDEPGSIGSGGNSGFQALNLAVQFGITRILLIGFDMNVRSGVHFYGRNDWPGSRNPAQMIFKRWCAAFESATARLQSRGIEVVNASAVSDLNCFPKATVEETLQAWGLAA